MKGWIRIALMVALTGAFMVACTNATRRDTDGDADGGSDADVEPCDSLATCDEAGFGIETSFEDRAEVIEVSDDHAVLLVSDGIPRTFTACGLSLSEAVAEGDIVIARNEHVDSWSDCWIATLTKDGQAVAFVANCTAEGQATPPLDDLGWTIDLETHCAGTIERVCATGGDPVYVVVPEWTYDLDLTTESGARGVVPLGETATVGEWNVANIEARSRELVDQGRCFLPATGQMLLAATRRVVRQPCVEPPDDAPYQLGLTEISASETVRDFRVGEITASEVELISDEGNATPFVWYGSDARRALRSGQRVVARRYDRDTTGGGFLDVIMADDRVALAVIRQDDFVFELPDLSVIDIDLALGDVCEFEQGIDECTGSPLIAQRYGVRVGAEGAETIIEVGETLEVGPWVATLFEASQYPGLWCEDLHAEAWGPFGITLMQEAVDEE